MEKKRAEIDEQLKDYIVEWRVQREKEEKELISLKEKQVKRKVSRKKKYHSSVSLPKISFFLSNVSIKMIIILRYMYLANITTS